MIYFDQIHPEIIEKLPKISIAEIAKEILLDSRKFEWGGRRVVKGKNCDFCVREKSYKNCFLLKKNHKSAQLFGYAIICDFCLHEDNLKKHVAQEIGTQVLEKRNKKLLAAKKKKAATKAYFAKLYPKKSGTESLEKLKNQEKVIQTIVDLCADSPLSQIKIFGYREFYGAHSCGNGYCQKSNSENIYGFIKVGKKGFHLCRKCKHKFRYLVERASKNKTDELTEFFDLLMDDL